MEEDYGENWNSSLGLPRVKRYMMNQILVCDRIFHLKARMNACQMSYAQYSMESVEVKDERMAITFDLA